VQRFLTNRHDSLGGRLVKVDQGIVSNVEPFSKSLLLSLILGLFQVFIFLPFLCPSLYVKRVLYNVTDFGYLYCIVVCLYKQDEVYPKILVVHISADIIKMRTRLEIAFTDPL
jgi:hypothetical protein